MEQNKKIIYDGVYLERYRKGELSAAEAHALEKASLEDPLLAEALEGYHSATRGSEPELYFLKQWVNERVEENQAAIRFLPKNRSMAPLLRIAAVFLVLTGAAWMTYFFWINPNQSQLASNSPKEPTQTPMVQETNTTNSAPPITQSAPPSEEKKPPVAAEKIEPINPQPITAQNPASAPVENEIRMLPPATDAMVESETKDKPAPPPNQRSNKETIVVTKNDAILSEAPTPEGGWKAYESYLERNRQPAPTASNTQVNPVVDLTFSIGQDGRPQDIQVVNSAGTFYDEKAIELLKKGPSWLPGKSSKRAELRVRF
ncbi:MAG: hypothetical protein FJX92_08955 [Bacteroidetes bacterium]|nr:hypothetical protein [Bacteroidota bacterium]